MVEFSQKKVLGIKNATKFFEEFKARMNFTQLNFKKF